MGREANPFKEALLRDINQLLGFGADGTAGVSCRAVAMKSLVKGSHIDGHDIPFLQDIAARNSVDNAVVHRNAS